VAPESGGFDAYAYRCVKIAVERVGFAALVIQAPFEKHVSSGSSAMAIADSVCENRNYNQHCSLLFPSLSSYSNQGYSVEGADAVSNRLATSGT